MPAADVERRPDAPEAERPQRPHRYHGGVVTATIGYATTQCISTLRKLLAASQLRRGDGVMALPDCRRKERLLGVGRTKLASKWVKLEVLHRDYNPRHDTCIKAFVRLLAAQNTPDQ